ncbi:peptide ABC transporter substrate-binding protein [Anaerocolumna sedimenticola]|uniref:Peptide ABC transporter substrate-binding protein n=1 Tax=Anaerocolumna sedimenticola TaxID=2696063 RepID=A0A6P1TJF8_9FIRM|nr:peptide ABC transporter substrate-binding protein [Anaerocolumna sedimenticola]QHQ61340.1 peptide ABC transporter substrate-binding protein [Anaerocolumna sedimenticola]
MKKKLVALAVGLSLIASVFSGCGKKGGSDDSVYRKLYSSEVTTMNYLVTNLENEYTIGANVIDTLVEYDSLGQIQPSLAESWEMSEDGLTYTFKLRQGQKWYDYEGNEVADVTADDFVSAAKYLLTPANESGTVQNYFGIIKNADEYYNSQVTDDPETEEVEGNNLDIDFSEVGVKALDNYTLQYTLAQPTPYFLSSLTYVCYMPAYGPLLDQLGPEFGTDNTKMYYNGAYILSEFAPQEKHVFTKNEHYWDADKVYVTKIEETYNSEALTLAPIMAENNEIDYAEIGADIADDWLSDSNRSQMVSKTRMKSSYSYFYSFNYDPQFDAEYEPDNWKLAVNNENFRQSLKAGLDRIKALTISEPQDPKARVSNTINPANFVDLNGKDYTEFGDLAAITSGDSFDEKAALSYKEKAMTELKAEGATFPVKILMPYNPTTTNWDKECVVVEQQLEALLGKDYIDIIVEAGPGTDFLSQVRRVGKYAFMLCNWGADYADPQTWTDPFTAENSYNFMDIAMNNGDGVADTVKEYYSLVDAAKAIPIDINARYEAFAKAEAYLIQHALAVPYSISSTYFVVTKLNPFEGQYAPFGVSVLRYKGQHLLDKPMSMDEFNKAQDDWKAAREKLAAQK